MMHSTAFRIGLGEDDPVAGDLVDGPDMFVVVADNFHVLADLAEHPALLLAALAPAGEVVLEPRLVLTPVVIIVAVELAHVPLAPRVIVRILVSRAIGPVRGACSAGAAIGIAAPLAIRAVAFVPVLPLVIAKAALAAAAAARCEELLRLVIAAPSVVAGHPAVAAVLLAPAAVAILEAALTIAPVAVAVAAELTPPRRIVIARAR